MDAPRFINALRIMWNLDRHHLVEAGVLDADDKHGWEVFRDYPHDAAIRLSDERAARLWTLVESRQKTCAAAETSRPNTAGRLRYAYAPLHPADRTSRPEALCALGDVMLVWVNEGDLLTIGEEVS